jgi:hypothetical protein
MLEDQSIMSNSRPLLKASLIFVISWLLFVALWVRINDRYCMELTKIATFLTTKVERVDLITLEMKSNTIVAELRPQRAGARILIYNYHLPGLLSFTAPLTLAMIAAFWPFMKRKLVCIEALVILLIANTLVIFCQEADQVSFGMMQLGYSPISSFTDHVGNILSLFMTFMGTYLTPFLIGVILYLRKN